MIADRHKKIVIIGAGAICSQDLRIKKPSRFLMNSSRREVTNCLMIQLSERCCSATCGPFSTGLRIRIGPNLTTMWGWLRPDAHFKLD